tara:strand:+ start:8933 stop:9388 length:456 start_codon:yes stop_codon:yes gene_type:complete
MKTITILIALLFSVSCIKEDNEATISLSIVYERIFTSKEDADLARKVKPVYAVMDKDKGSFTFDLIQVAGGAVTNEIIVDAGVYQILDVRVYDAEGNMTHQVYHGKPPQSSMVTGWVYDEKDGPCIKPGCSYDYYFEGHNQLLWQVFLTKN